MKKSIYLLVITALFVYCTGKKSSEQSQLTDTTTIQTAETIEELQKGNEEITASNTYEDWSPFYGTWIHRFKSGEPEYFTLSFIEKDGTLYFAEYYVDRHPFSEGLKGKLVQPNKAELYFSYIEGSNSFNASADNFTEEQFKACKETKTAECTINPDGTMTLITFTDSCGALPDGKKFVLKKE